MDQWSVSFLRPTIEDALINDTDDVREIVSPDEIDFGPRSRLNRFLDSHPRFLWFLLLNLFVTPLLVYAGMQIVASHPPIVINALMMSSGAQTMSATELATYVKAENRLAYWLNDSPGDRYTDNNTRDGINSISYIPAGSNLAKLDEVKLTINTYRDFATYDSQLQPLSGVSETKISMANGVNMEYDQTSANREIITFSTKPEVVVVDYPAAQDVSTLLRNAGNLTPIR